MQQNIRQIIIVFIESNERKNKNLILSSTILIFIFISNISSYSNILDKSKIKKFHQQESKNSNFSVCDR